MSDENVRILDREIAYRGFFRIDRYRLQHRLYAGGWSGAMTREVFERGHSVAVLPYDPAADEIVLVEQFRLPAHVAGLGGWQLEVIAGMMDHGGEAAAEVARREAGEEAGIELGELLPIHRYLPSPGGSSETIDLYCGRTDTGSAGGLHGLATEHEDIKVVVLPWREALLRMNGGGIDNGPTLLALYWLRARRAALRRRWRD